MEAVIFTGIQGSGKSSFYLERFYRTHVRMNLDMLKTRRREAILLRACIEAKQSFVVDNCNSTVAERARYIEIAKRGHFRVAGYYLESKIADALRRNEQRPPDQRVPRAGVLGTYKKLQIPTLDEGFDALFFVRLSAHGVFSVEEWQSEVHDQRE